MSRSRFVQVSVAAIAMLALFSGSAEWGPAVAKDEDEKEHKYIQRITAKAYSIAGASTKTFSVQIGIKRFSTDEERQALLQAIKDGGTEGATKALSEQDELGYIRVGSGYQILRYVKEFQQGDKRTIIMATNRPLRYGEVHYGLRSADYTIGMVQIELNEKGKGTGSLSPYCKISFNEETQRLDVGINMIQPTRLSGVRLR